SAPAHAAIGARRLAILDLSERGHQPMPARDRLAWIVHNGEIYNYLELREQLAADGWVFESSTDTEVLLAAFQAWGPSCFTRFDGMWATAIYEPDARRLILSRDPFGIKPLYFTRWPSGFAFASEIKALLGLRHIAPKVNHARLIDFLTEGWLDHTGETMFEGIHSLPGGSRLTLTCTESAAYPMEVHRDFDPPPRLAVRQPIRHDQLARAAEAHAAELRARIEQAVRIQLRSDVPVGSCLSGGIDSSAIV